MPSRYIEEMKNFIFAGGSCTLKLDSEPSADTVAKINASEGVVAAMLK
jgi:hypothetical protein